MATYTPRKIEMKEIKLTVNGKEVQLTDQQLKALGIEVETNRKNPFERVEKFNDYYCVEKNSEIYVYRDNGSSFDNRLYNTANYFNDKEFAEQVALHQLLYRKLLKFAYDNECEDNQIWDNNGVRHWTIRYNVEDRRFEPDWSIGYNYGGYGGVYFSNRKGAERAIKEVVEPFMKEHPNFVW